MDNVMTQCSRRRPWALEAWLLSILFLAHTTNIAQPETSLPPFRNPYSPSPPTRTEGLLSFLLKRLPAPTSPEPEPPHTNQQHTITHSRLSVGRQPDDW
ncbi:hypothetical protein BDN70DRAFT_886409 [Pholiota conissans]|uniref:Uncharacterized protein n=1 Tax=Pholiota conissans TaxID=109636 RepID=A0A9P5YP73_9AGAR|nr:hypothetical protein BDN70DRAFT_886409 [Pholiota conissans]